MYLSLGGEGRASTAGEAVNVRAAAPFAVMAKPVGPLCNLRCSYCYYLDTGPQGCGLGHSCMSNALLERYIRQYIEASPGRVVPFTWHGGEPTLAGLNFYRLVVELQKKYLPAGWRCWNNLQTNGVLLDDEWCAFLAEAGFDVGLSIDGAEGLHDEHRKDPQGRGSHGRAAAAIRRLQAHGVQPDLLCTVTAAAAKDPLAVYRTLRAFDTGWIQFIPIVCPMPEGGVTAESVTGEGYGYFLCEIFDEWCLNDLGRLDVQLFAEAAMVLAGGEASLCWMAPACGRVLVVERDGGVYSCDHFVTPAHRIGGITSGHLGNLVESTVQRNFGKSKQELLPAECKQCTWFALCNGGCPKDRFLQTEAGEPGRNYLCAGLQRFFAHAEKPLRQMVEARGQGKAPAAIMAALRDEARARWAGVGRNDPCVCGSGRKAKQCCWHKRP